MNESERLTEDAPWRILIIEDQVDLAEDAKRELVDSVDNVVVSIETDFDKGYDRVAKGEADIVVLDVRRDPASGVEEDDAAGRRVFVDIKKARFAPVVFWTALPGVVADQEMKPLVSVIQKDDIALLPDAVRAAISSGAVTAIAEIEQEVASVLRQHMWSELGPNWDEYVRPGNANRIAPVLVSRLARVLEGAEEYPLSADPSHRYIYPPVDSVLNSGDILRDDGGDWWVVLTPACDLAQRKFDFVLLGRAGRLASHPRFAKWNANRSRSSWKELAANVLAATQGRFRFLPRFREIPDLVIDLEDVRSVPADQLDRFSAVASLASPFAESLLVQHSHFRGRVGVPDLDLGPIEAQFAAMPVQPTAQQGPVAPDQA